MSEQKQIEEMAKVIHESDMNYNTTFPISMGECLAKHGAVRTNAGIALYNAGFRKPTEWISVSERLPDEELQELRSNDPEMTFRCLTARMSEDNHGETYVYQAFYDEKRGKKRFVNENGVDITASVTHWKPLPEPPVMKGGAE